MRPSHFPKSLYTAELNPIVDSALGCLRVERQLWCDWISLEKLSLLVKNTTSRSDTTGSWRNRFRNKCDIQWHRDDFISYTWDGREKSNGKHVTSAQTWAATTISASYTTRGISLVLQTNLGLRKPSKTAVSFRESVIPMRIHNKGKKAYTRVDVGVEVV